MKVHQPEIRMLFSLILVLVLWGASPELGTASSESTSVMTSGFRGALWAFEQGPQLPGFDQKNLVCTNKTMAFSANLPMCP